MRSTGLHPWLFRVDHVVVQELAQARSSAGMKKAPGPFFIGYWSVAQGLLAESLRDGYSVRRPEAYATLALRRCAFA